MAIEAEGDRKYGLRSLRCRPGRHYAGNITQALAAASIPDAARNRRGTVS